MKKVSAAVLFVIFSISCFLNSCSSLNELKVAGTNFGEEISQSQNLVFSFNKDIVSDSQLDAWDSTQYIRFEPAVRGKFKWSAPNELIFSPTSGFQSATSYKAKLTDKLLQKSRTDKAYKLSDEPISFHTPFLQLTDTESWWTLSKETRRPEARIKLIFNYPINAQQVSERLKILIADKSADYKIIPSGEGRQLTVALTHFGSADNNPVPVSVKIEKGLKAPNISYITNEILERTISLPSPLHLEIADVKTGFENNKSFVRIITTQELEKSALDSVSSLNPAVGTNTEITENGFILRGDFNETDTYVLSIKQSLKSVLGHNLEDVFSKDLFFGKMPAGIAFANKKALYMTSKGSKNIGVQITNVPQVQVQIAKLYANNILTYLRANRWEEYGYVGDEWASTGGFNYNEDEEGNFSDIIVNKVVDTENLPKNRGVSALNLALSDDNGRRGIYLVSVHSKEEAYLGATKLVSISDIGLIAKQGKDELWIFANSIKTNEPLANVEITLISSNNQSFHTLTTDREGVAHVDKLGEKASGFKLAMITAANTDDFNYLLLEDTRVETSRFEVEGQRDNSTGLQAFIYGQRDMYRPGETLYFNTVLRKADWQTAAEIPLKLRLVTPNGREYRTWRKSTNKQGAVEIQVPIDMAALTGTYVFEVYNANDIMLSSQPVNVEEFMPDRIKVDLSGAQNEYLSGATVNLTASALNLFGPPATNRTYEMEMQLKRKSFFAPAFPEFTFDITAETTFEKELRQGITNEKGQAIEKFLLAPGLKDIGVLEGKIYVTVFDENGRPVNRMQRFDVLTQPIFYGIRLQDTYFGVNASVPVEIIGVNNKGMLQGNTKAKAEVVRIDYQTVIEKKNERLNYTSRKSEKVVYSNIVNLSSGKAMFQYVPTVSGEYEVRVRRPDATYFTVSRFYAYGSGYTQYSSFEVSSEGRVLMETDKEKYQIGENARILFKTPFDGRLLVTVERNSVMEHHILTTEKKAAELKLNLKEAYLPNVFVTATLIRPLDHSDLPLTVANGFIPIMVGDTKRQLPLAITSVEKSRSKTKQHIRVKTQANAEVTIAVVDEGILQIKNFRTPDIHGYFYQKRALEVSSHNLYALLFPELNSSGISSFGGDGYDLEKRINPLSNGRTELVSFWSGQLTANANGEATFDVNIPQFSGDLRIMAVAYKGNAFGSASRNMKVADPIVISTGFPRFLSPGDALTLPVNISNTEKRAADATVTLTASNPLVSGDATITQKLIIQPGKEQRAIFSLKALAALGVSKVTVKVTALGETFVQQGEIMVRPASPLLKTSNAGTIAGGQQAAIDLSNSFIPATASSKITISRSPLVGGGGKALASLIGYPYGCLEQSISKAFPQLYFADLAKTMATPVYLVKTGESDFNPVTNVQQAIRKIESQQLFNGAAVLWPGSTEEDWWTTAYAVHFLEEARRAGFEINPQTMAKAIQYLIAKTGTTANRETTLASNDRALPAEARTQVRKLVARREAIYSLYVLALTGSPNRPAMNYYKQNPQLLTLDTRYLLAGAFQLIGDSRSFTAILPKSYVFQNNVITDDSYASPLRNLGLVLNTLLETDTDNLQITPLARQLSKAIQSSRYINTQEASFAVLALGKIAHKASASSVTADIHVNGKKIAGFDGQNLQLSKGIANQKLAISTQGKGELYWFSQSEGMSSTGNYVEEDHGLHIRRQFLTRAGKPVTKFQQNDLVVVKLSLSSTNGFPVDNVVITDLLPAGFEIENPRVTETREMPWIKNAAVPTYFDIRDDRIHFFTSASQTEKVFYYQIRVISKGTFAVGPASADAMYEGEYRSYSGGGKISVE